MSRSDKMVFNLHELYGARSVRVKLTNGREIVGDPADLELTGQGCDRLFVDIGLTELVEIAEGDVESIEILD